MIKLYKSVIAIALSFLCLLSSDKIEIHHNDDQLPGFGMCEHDFRFFAQINNILYFIDLNPRLTLEVQNKYNFDLSFYLFGRPPPKIL